MTTRTKTKSTASNRTQPAKETAAQRCVRRAGLTRNLEREAVTLRQNLREHGDLAEVAKALQQPPGWAKLLPVSEEEADEVAAWAILRSMRQAAGLSTFFMDYPAPPEYVQGATTTGTLYEGVIVTRLVGFDVGVTCQEVVRDCGGTMQQAREALKRLVKKGVVETVGDGYVLAADVETYVLPIFAGQMELRRRQAARTARNSASKTVGASDGEHSVQDDAVVNTSIKPVKSEVEKRRAAFRVLVGGA